MRLCEKSGPYGRIPDDLTASSNEVTNASFFSVGKPIGRERLMCKGKGAPRSLVRKELIAVFSAVVDSFNLEINFVIGSFSAVEGYPRSSQREFLLKSHPSVRLNNRDPNASIRMNNQDPNSSAQVNDCEWEIKAGHTLDV